MRSAYAELYTRSHYTRTPISKKYFHGPVGISFKHSGSFVSTRVQCIMAISPLALYPYAQAAPDSSITSLLRSVRVHQRYLMR